MVEVGGGCREEVKSRGAVWRRREATDVNTDGTNSKREKRRRTEEQKREDMGGNEKSRTDQNRSGQIKPKQNNF